MLICWAYHDDNCDADAVIFSCKPLKRVVLSTDDHYEYYDAVTDAADTVANATDAAADAAEAVTEYWCWQLMI